MVASNFDDIFVLSVDRHHTDLVFGPLVGIPFIESERFRAFHVGRCSCEQLLDRFLPDVGRHGEQHIPLKQRVNIVCVLETSVHHEPSGASEVLEIFHGAFKHRGVGYRSG